MSLARKHQDISFIARQMREKHTAVCLIVHVSAFVTYKRALRSINTYTKHKFQKRLYKKDVQQENNTRKP